MYHSFMPVSTEFVHKAVMIGDEVAEGFGDWIVCGQQAGAMKHVHNLMCEDVRVRHRWHLVNCGLFGSTSEDWLPDLAPTYRVPWTRVPRLGVGHNFFDKMFGEKSGIVRDAEIVIVCVGRNDEKAAHLKGRYDRSVDNIKKIATTLRDMGKIVLLCTIPLPADSTHVMWLPNRTRNDMLRAFVKEQEYEQQRDMDDNEKDDEQRRRKRIDERTKAFNDVSAAPKGRIVMGADLGHFGFTHPDLLSADGHHFNSKGYKQFGQELYRDKLALEAVKVEFRTWKKVAVRKAATKKSNDDDDDKKE
eukprot:TRINITY_DN66588_c3_g1_i2.p1 TRINITY_DN66588_c3_g1~~TRINITY_DN66588_c3_g1_i2.p1  ORF type:complete len:303 (-),score=169.31 TRINITY_DN66588_c3_g1_i2:36-944(-)